MIGEVAVLAEFHDDDEYALFDEGMLVRYDVRVVELAEKIRLKMSALFLLLGELAEDDFLGDEVDLLVHRRLPQLDEESGSKVSAANALDFLELLLVADLQLVGVCCLRQR